MKLIIDCHGLAYRVVFNMADLSFAGQKTGVIFGFLSQIRDLALKFETNQFIFCWDSRQSYRKIADEDYKVREPDPKIARIIEEARPQFMALRDKILPEMGFKNIFLQTGYEADDLIAWVVARYPNEYMIVTGDDDILQLLYDNKYCPVYIYHLFYSKVITEKDFKEKYGLKSAREWAQVKGLAGCKSDTVSGIPGVGIGTAVKYLNGVLKDSKIKQKIESDMGKAIFRRCLDLVSLPYRGYQDISVPEVVEDNLFSLDFMDVFKEYGLASFVRDFEKWRSSFKLHPGRE